MVGVLVAIVCRSRCCSGDQAIIAELGNIIDQQPVQWETATLFPRASHIHDVGDGGICGVGVLTHLNKDGTWIRIMIAGTLEGTNSSYNSVYRYRSYA